MVSFVAVTIIVFQLCRSVKGQLTKPEEDGVQPHQPTQYGGGLWKFLMAAVRELRQVSQPQGSQEPNSTRHLPRGFIPHGKTGLLSDGA